MTLNVYQCNGVCTLKIGRSSIAFISIQSTAVAVTPVNEIFFVICFNRRIFILWTKPHMIICNFAWSVLKYISYMFGYNSVERATNIYTLLTTQDTAYELNNRSLDERTHWCLKVEMNYCLVLTQFPMNADIWL